MTVQRSDGAKTQTRQAKSKAKAGGKAPKTTQAKAKAKAKVKTKKVKTKTKPALCAKNADKHALYEASVQDTDFDLEFIDKIYKKTFARYPLTLREDFCGTALLCADWVASRPRREAWGLDLHQPTMNWGLKHHVAPLGDKAERVHLLRRNVLDGCGVAVDVAVAFNFSYCIFHERAQMLAYFRSVLGELGREGMFVLDLHGGTECFVEVEEEKEVALGSGKDCKPFTYVWDQEPYDPIQGLATRHIHFRFRDGSVMRRAFTYDWRLWTLPELRDLLMEAGASKVDTYWEGADGKGGGNGDFRKTKRAENEESFVAYLVAVP